MTFEQAFDAAFERESTRSAAKGEKFVVSPATAKTLTFLWNMIALSNGKVDDCAFLDDMNNIVSQPLEKKGKGAKKPSENEGVDGQEDS